MVSLGLFITTLESDPLLFVSVVFTVVVSITLHELSHGWIALRLGDPTPRQQDRMTVNPLVHMGPWSFAALMIAGIAWGQMPIDRSRLRGRHGDAWVALAGPALNLLLAAVALTALGLWMRLDERLLLEPTDQTRVLHNAALFVRVFGFTNLLLCVFNLLPIPPLDGSHTLASFHRGYAEFISDPNKQGIVLLMFLFAFMFATALFEPVQRGAMDYVHWLARG